MEAVNRIPEALNPPRRSLLGFASTPRRSHLDSASYRSLVRIFSHCLDHSLVPPPPSPKDSVSRPGIPFAGEASTSAQRRFELLRKPQEVENDKLATLSKRVEDGDRHANRGGREEIAGSHAKLLDTDLVAFDPSDEKETEVAINNDVLSRFAFGRGELVGAPNEETCSRGDLNEGNGYSIHETSVRNELEILKVRVYGSEDGTSHLCDVLGTDKGPFVAGESKHSEESMPNSLKEFANEKIRAAELDDLVRREPVEDVLMVNLAEIECINSKVVVEKEKPVEQQTCFHSTKSIDHLGLRNFEENQTNSIDHQNDDSDIEEGEISGDIQELEESVDIINEGQVLKEKNTNRASFDHFSDALSTIDVQCNEEESEHGAADQSSAIYRKGVSSDYEAKLFDAFDKGFNDIVIEGKKKVLEDWEKRKNRTLTMERKAKKKCAKKRKRAQKNREQGVKKLKLHPVVKPKEVKYCNFYLMGRCQQGNLCKFSHDTIPMTKSMPCKHFACNSCLKGDDCPFDHELSKYPCHNYASTGYCNRGDRCKFSHKIPTTNASSPSAIGKIDSCLSAEKLKLRKQPVRVSYSSPGIGPPEDKTNGNSFLKPLKAASQMPKGIRFLSFGTPPMDSSNKANESSLSKPELLSQQKQHNLSSNSLPSLKPVMPNKSVCVSAPFGSAINGSAATSMGTLNHEVSEATRILEEFLFCSEV
ncbi:hypothetical protein HPP92_005499 [Vanilla planifolia]|uniref:C3H1-type domain-containing protein n=1 Tax=Vanilla planifolia TaxID=51239 RepID=A0A835VD86_VANPL|nr:hypothetical protein HPP92_005499 [Vanilla planifolia]